MSYDASSRKDIRKAEKELAVRDRERVQYLSASMDTYQGRTFFLDLLESCHIFADPFTGNALHEAYLKGERNIGLKLYTDIVTNCPDQFVRMMREQQARKTDDGRRTDSSERPGSSNANGGFEGPVTTEFDPYADPDTGAN